MVEFRTRNKGFWTFLPYGLTVFGAALGMFYVRYGTDHANPVLGVAVGAIAGRLLATGIARIMARR